MYLEHFGLEIFPFKITPDPAFLCPNRQNRRALSLLRSAIARQCPLMVVTGEVGTGKTTLIRHVLQQSPEGMAIGLLSNFPGWANDILPWVLNTFDLPDATDEVTRVQAFERFVRTQSAAGRRCALIVDEAQNVSVAGLEQLRRLLNVNTGKDVQVMIILVGQKELHDKLKTPQCAAIAQRIGMSIRLDTMSAEETERYIRHRLTVAGGKPDIFDGDAIAAVQKISGGNPRLVNVVCDTAMVMAFGTGDKVINRKVIGWLGERDTILSHVPEIAINARAAPETRPRPVTATDFGFCGFEESPVGSEILEFASVWQPERKAEVREERSGEAGRAATDLGKPARSVPASPLAEPESAAADAELRPDAPPDADPPLRRNEGAAPRVRPARRVGLVRLLGGTAAGGLVAAGAFFLAPLALQDDATTESPETVAMRSLAAIAPPAPGGTELHPSEPAVPLTDLPGAAFLDRALATGATDPAAAAIDYARAALRGEDLAAYYLGQLYETGDGVTLDLARARSWYASVETSVRGARRRLADLGPPLRSGALAAPVPLLGGALDTGGAEFVWTSGEGADPAFFVVELSDGPVSTLRRLPPQDLSALRVDEVGEAQFWRVFAVAPDMHSYAVSDWRAMGPAETAMTTASAAVLPEAVVQIPESTAPERLAEVTDVLDAARIPYRVEASGSGGVEELQIAYFFEGDAAAARKIADAVGARSAVMLADTGGPDPTRPLPGQVIIRSADR